MAFHGKCRSMRAEDIDAICELEKLCFPAPWSKKAFKEELKNDLARYYVLLSPENVPVAYGGLWLVTDQAHITNIAVHPDYRREGLGRFIVQKLMRCALDEGAVSMTLEVRVSNGPAIALYRSLGFESAGVRPNYYTNNREDALIMWNKHPEQYVD